MKISGNPRYLYLSAILAGAIFSLSETFSVLFFKETYANEMKVKSQTETKNISAKQAKELLEKERDVFILDVRTKGEYEEAHIKDSHLIPIKELEQNIEKIPKDKKVVVHCARGKRSAKACEILKNKGLKELYNVEGGINQWKAEGYPVEKP